MKRRASVILLALLLPAVGWTQTENGADQAQPADSAVAADEAPDNDAESPEPNLDARRKIEIKVKSEFVCAEVPPEAKAGDADHEIILTPRTIERCELIKVGTRLHECIKLKIEQASTDVNGVVRIDTKEGAVHFWLDEETRISTAETKGTLVFTWPDNDRKYLCASYRK